MTAAVRQPAPDATEAAGQFGRRVRMVTPGHGFMILGTAAIIAAALAWGIFGSIATRVAGQGLVVTANEEVNAVETVATGVMQALLVKVGDEVDAGQPVARLDQPELASQVELAQQRLEELEARLADVRAEATAERNHRRVRMEAELAALAQQIQHATGRARRFATILDSAESLLARGNARVLDIEDLRRNRDAADADRLRAEWQQVAVRGAFLEYNDALNTRVADAERRVSDQHAECEALRKKLAWWQVVRSQTAGHVEEIRVPNGAVVRPGEPIMIVTRESDQYDVLAFLTAAEGKRVKIGMAAHVIPQTIRKEEFGAIRGTVIGVSERAVSEAAINAMVLDETLARSFVRDGAPIFVRIRLEEREDSPSGFAWWSGRGPDFRIETGTIARVEVVLRRHRPITVLLPALNHLIGL
jgi:HlyD family secretion protein